MTKARCLDLIQSAMTALEDMRDALDDSSPDAAQAYLEAAQDVHNSVSRAITEAMLPLVLNVQDKAGNSGLPVHPI